MSLQHDYTLNPVTALAFCKHPNGRFLLAAEGLYLKVFEIGDVQRLIAQCRVFKEQTIHGIVVSEDGLQIVIWGGSLIIILLGLDLKAIVEGEICDVSPKESSAPDWILSIALSPNPEERDFVLLTAHNSLLRVSFSQNPWEISFQPLDSPARSILYSAHVIYLSSDSIMVAAGTVFGEIIVWVWQCSLREVTKAAILFTFTGHEGSIFGVRISPQFYDSSGKAKRLLASCSDDRTIRLWDLSPNFTQEERNTNAIDSKLILRQTGFGDNSDVDASDSTTDAHNRCLSVAWGHASRIWRVLFGQIEPDSERMSLLSFGEDATCQLWSIDLRPFDEHLESGVATKPSNTSTSPEVQLRHCKTFAYHSGKHIWAADLLYLGDCDCLVATGGADGKLSCFQISSTNLESLERQLSNSWNTQDVTNDQYQVYALEEILLALPTIYSSELSTNHTEMEIGEETVERDDDNHAKKVCSKKSLKDGLNRYSFITDNIILLTSTAGRVFLGTHKPQRPIDWQEVQSPSISLDLRGYSVITSIPEIGLAVFGGANGNIYKLENGQSIKVIGSVNGKVAALFLTLDQNHGQSLHLLVTVLGGYEAFLFSWDKDSTFDPIKRSSITLPPKLIVTSASKVGALIYVGFRNGAIGIMDPDKPVNITLTYRPPVAADADAITSIIEIPKRTREACVSYLLATSRNGTYMILSFDIIPGAEHSDANMTMVPIHHSSPPLGAIENAWFEGPNLYFYGFRGKQFIVWNETEKFEVMAVECGGAHRSYAYYHLNGSSGGGTFVYTKVSKLYLHSHESGSHKIIKDGGHGREMKACAVSSGKKYLATGAEDTTIRIWKYENTTENTLNNNFECLSVIEKHTAGIQHLQWQGDNYLFSSGGTEEFYIWRIQETPNFGVGVICEATLLDQSPEKDLRIMSFDVMDFPQNDSLTDLVFPETIFLISLAFSDSTIKSYLYSKNTGFQCLANVKHTSSCLTQLRYLPYPPPTPQGQMPSSGPPTLKCDIYILTAGTDGHITTWCLMIEDVENLDISSFHRPLGMTRMTNFQVHQNAIKSLDIRSLSNWSFIIATGGDDNALAFTYFGWFVDRPSTTIIKNAHGAAITALKFLDVPGEWGEQRTGRVSGKKVVLRLVSSSNDQRVKVWDVEVLEKGPMESAFVDVEVVGDEFTAVADVGDMAVLKSCSRVGGGNWSIWEEVSEKVVVVGNGMDVWAV